MTPPTDRGSVSIWINQLKEGNPAAVKPLWDGYFARLVGLARDRLRSRPRAAADEEDVALSAFNSFCRAAAEGRFPKLDDRDDLWQLLFLLTTRKAIGLIRHEERVKRRPGRQHANASGPVEDALSPEPSPAQAAEVAEGFSRLLKRLPNHQLQQVAMWKLEGYTNAEIALKLDRAIPTVERSLKAIRTIWGRELQ
jgi:DNA-directed RNA polymerase specialized sigma24 family protein